MLLLVLAGRISFSLRSSLLLAHVFALVLASLMKTKLKTAWTKAFNTWAYNICQL